ncbi:hypothetical protein COCSADRAFT_31925 [Bipolaris sorokiniana ND90Pr]|uniref:RNA polymerase sigma-70 ECF-like HTH domain-containing protein n=1 Tax=Cochliobolus sativus (strain ND90Pr / ATCC 201652) TaxID=665912 RepID=M2RRH0_COCSN|nr:uncharacterized protein COCSADRAFT_31925 [Bipolaris sorokiniana ND90Pr]EMD69164.1 hypothetical protein COCSADRAFT_31925 [Bipolaris sorokiniana ND90Pr]
MRKRAPRTCPQNPSQDGVCGCHAFWERSKQSSSNAEVTADATEGSEKTIVEQERKKKRRKRGGRKQRRKEEKKKTEEGKVKETMQVLVDYELPYDDERLDWDTDEVRRMVG